MTARAAAANPADLPRAAGRVIHAPLLAAITRHPTGGGIAAVTNLLWDALQSQWGASASLETLFDHENRTPGYGEKARFGMAVASAQLAGRTDWMLFTHIGLVRALRVMPSKWRRPYGVFLHGIEAWGPLSEGDIQLMAAADVRIANSHFTARRVMAAHPGIGAVEACPLALPPSFATSTGATGLPYDIGRRAVLVVARMAQAERYKGHDQLLDAWPRVLARVPDATLVFVGGGDDVERLKHKAATCGSSVIFTGFVSEPTLQALYRNAALFALPSTGEGFGLVYLEAMKHGLACVGSTADAASEVIADGVTGRLVDPHAIGEIGDVLSTLLINESALRAMGEAGRLRAATEFGFDRFSARLRALVGSTHQPIAA